ncbi:tetratricopeptide repeat protein [Pseudorhodoferax sp.]|uniref:tetratricopeptide repeat protein n=1 Tax=Pseudorhodoferax sp. TaxID=1993553 RepID=UPI002DD63768|nr:tetratricopeptide repeat protein [Pseudorhodoferax sp.]
MNVPTDDAFQQAKALFLDAVALTEGGRHAEAETRLEAAVALVPDRPSTLLNLGVVRLRLGRPQDALATLDALLALEPQQPAGRFQRALALNQLGRHPEALAALDALLGAQPELAPAHQLRGQTLQALERHAEALPAYERAVALDPGSGEGFSLLGQLLRDLQRPDAARVAFERALAAGADPVLCRYFLAGLGAGDAPAGAPQAYVRGLFDHYADDFEPHLLTVLRYRAHEAVVQAAAAALPATPVASALDLGCGTGLCGPLLRPLARSLHGIDLSPTMLERARARGVYDTLEQADLVEHLQATPQRHGLVTAADVFIYVGALDAVFAGVRRVLEPGGVFAFSVEQAEHDVVLRPSLRYAHGEAGLRALAAQHGLQVVQVQALALRQEQRQPIAGLVLCLRAPG